MTKTRLSALVDAELLERSRRAHGATTDAALVEAALEALLAVREAEIDEAYRRAYVDHPFDEPDAWGNLAEWCDRARSS